MNLQIFAGLFLFALGLEDLLESARQASSTRIDRWSRRFRLALLVQAFAKVVLAGLLVSEGVRILQMTDFTV